MMRRYARMVLVIVLGGAVACQAAQPTGPGLPDPEDVANANACGPIACFMAGRALGAAVTLPEMIRQCGWKVGQRTRLDTIQNTLAGIPGLTSTPIRVTPDELLEFLQAKRGVAVLPVRKHGASIDHAVVAIAVQNGNVVLMDYPELSSARSMEQLVEVWDGPALLVSRQPPQALAGALVGRGGVAVACFVAGILIVRWLKGRPWRRARRWIGGESQA